MDPTLTSLSRPAAGLRALLDGLIDYAGLFPPARLSLPDAVREYHELLARQEAWILSRFICPAARLGDLKSLETHVGARRPWHLAVLGAVYSTIDALVGDIDEALGAIRATAEHFADRIIIDAFEVKMLPPIQGAEAGQAVRATLAAICQKLETATPHVLRPFIEIGFVDPWRETVGAAIAAVADVRRSWSGRRCLAPGVKIRTGGTDASAFPSVDQVAFWIAQCVRHGVPFKATAGLHHPLRHDAPSVNAKMHGFLNVFVAAVLAWAHKDAGIVERQLAEILMDESAASFAFTNAGLSWRERTATTSQIQEARRLLALSYGSCSFQEPVEDLRSLNLL